MIPTDRFSKSWVVSRKDNGKVVGEYYHRGLVEMFNQDKVLIETAYQYLTRINREFKENV